MQIITNPHDCQLLQALEKNTYLAYLGALQIGKHSLEEEPGYYL